MYNSGMKLSACLLAILASMSSAFAQEIRPHGSELSAIRQEIQAKVAAGSIPGLSIAVAKKGKIIWEEGFGWADVENKTRATANTPYYIASVTKTITATAILQLQERGKLRLDNPVNDYLGPDKVHSPMWNASDATVRRVLSHTSGLTTFARWCLPGDSGCEIGEEIQRYGILVWPPGELFDYSNIGYGVLGEVVERTSGKSFDSYLRSELFDPLGMHHCGLTLSSSVAKMAAAQYDQNTHARSPVRVTGHQGASEVRCSVHDLMLFGEFHLEQSKPKPAILSHAAVEEMHRGQEKTRGQYGLGWWIREQKNYHLIFAQGGTTDSFAMVKLVPSEDLVLVVVANSYANFVTDLPDKILTALLPGFAEKPDSPVKKAPPDPSQLAPMTGRWTGAILTYDGSVPVSLEISADGSARGQVGEQPLSNLANTSLTPRHFYGQLPGTSAIVDAPSHPHTLELDLAIHGDDLVGAATTGPLPGQDGDAFPHWVKLTRAK